MKKSLFTILAFLACTGILLSQNNPFPENEAVWQEEHITIAGPTTHHFALCGDTLINGHIYTQVLDLQLDSAMNVVGSSYAGAIRSGGGVVRYQPNYQSDEYVLFDFNLQQGDVIDLYKLYATQPSPRTVDSTATELIAGKIRKVIYFKPGFPGAPVEFWIEGIGSNYGLLGRAQDPGGDLGFTLLCYEHGDEYLNLTLIECFLPELGDCSVVNPTGEAAAVAAFSISPNPASDLLRVQRSVSQGQPWAVEIVGLQGQVLGKTVAGNDAEALLETGHLPVGGYFLKILDVRSGALLQLEKVVIGR